MLGLLAPGSGRGGCSTFTGEAESFIEPAHEPGAIYVVGFVPLETAGLAAADGQPLMWQRSVAGGHCSRWTAEGATPRSWISSMHKATRSPT